MVGYLLSTQGVSIGIGGDQTDTSMMVSTTTLLVLAGGIAGAYVISSAIPGAVLVWLLRQPRPEEKNASR